MIYKKLEDLEKFKDFRYKYKLFILYYLDLYL
jgi:hypothetical protein